MWRCFPLNNETKMRLLNAYFTNTTLHRRLIKSKFNKQREKSQFLARNVILTLLCQIPLVHKSTMWSPNIFSAKWKMKNIVFVYLCVSVRVCVRDLHRHNGNSIKNSLKIHNFGKKNNLLNVPICFIYISLLNLTGEARKLCFGTFFSSTSF